MLLVVLAYCIGLLVGLSRSAPCKAQLVTCLALARAYEAEAWECVRVVDNFVKGPN